MIQRTTTNKSAIEQRIGLAEQHSAQLEKAKRQAIKRGDETEIGEAVKQADQIRANLNHLKAIRKEISECQFCEADEESCRPVTHGSIGGQCKRCNAEYNIFRSGTRYKVVWSDADGLARDV